MENLKIALKQMFYKRILVVALSIFFTACCFVTFAYAMECFSFVAEKDVAKVSSKIGKNYFQMIETTGEYNFGYPITKRVDKSVYSKLEKEGFDYLRIANRKYFLLLIFQTEYTRTCL